MTRTERDLAERALLRTIQHTPSILDSCFDDLFNLPKNRALYRAFVSEYERTRPALDTIAAALAAGISTHEMLTALDVDARGGSYEYVVKDAWLADEIARLTRDTSQMHGLDALIATEKAVGELRARLQLRNGAQETFAEFLSSDASLYKTSFGPIDQHYGGFAAGEIVIIAARPGVGKTTMACTLAANFAQRATKCVLHSYEMRPSQIWSFLCARMSMRSSAPVSISDIRKRAFTDEQKEMLIRHHDHLAAYGLTVENSAGIDVASLASSIETSDAPIHIIDHIGHVPCADASREYDLVTAVSNRLQRAAKRSGKVMIELVQLSRQEGGRPNMRHLRGSGHLEQDADTIIFLHEPDQEENRAQGRTVVDVEFIIDKAREGQPGFTTIRINRPYAYAYRDGDTRSQLTEQLPAF